MYCKYYWNKLDYEKSIEWGDKGLLLLKQSEADITVDIEHTLYLAKRDSRNKERIKEEFINEPFCLMRFKSFKSTYLLPLSSVHRYLRAEGSPYSYSAPMNFRSIGLNLSSFV